jgi:hypothetical protein
MSMTTLFTTYRTRVALVVIATTIAVGAIGAHRWPVPPAEALTIDVAIVERAEIRDRQTASSEPPPPCAGPVDHDTSTITEVVRAPGCGVSIGVTQIRYGDDFGVAIPCLEFFEGRGLRFAVGETQTIIVDDHDQVIAIRSHGVTRRFDGGYESVRTPPEVIGHLGWSADSHMSYETFEGSQPHWSWKASRVSARTPGTSPSRDRDPRTPSRDAR